LGLRYEWQNNLNDSNNFSPRIGFVWSPEKSGKFIVRGGIGVFYDWFDTQTLSSIFSNNSRQGQNLIIINPGFPDRGLSNLDQRHKLNLSFNFDIWKKIKVSPSFRLESGFPYTVTTGRDDNGDTVFNNRPFGIGRNTERGEWLKQFDVLFQWKLPTKYIGFAGKNDKRSINLNANVRNLFNTANLTNYVGVQTSPFFGRATLARPARSVDLGLSFIF